MSYSADDYAHDREEFNQRLAEVFHQLDPHGEKSDALGDVLLAHALRILHHVHGADRVAKHLATLAVRFEGGGEFIEIAAPKN
jgi:LDH2 family malate/lactate/ureidoglycolate dehydrogenase